MPAVARMEATRYQQLALAPERPAVMLIARSIDARAPERKLPLVGPHLDVIGHPLWISEAMVDLYGWKPGQLVNLPLAGKLHNFTVAGIWRDYARQTGAIQMRIEDYRHLTADEEVNDIALWIKRDQSMQELRRQIEALPFSAPLEFAEPGEIRAISLKIFDRSFAVTYLLEGVAIIIGLFGVAATFSAQTLSRVKEFGMLRHIGVTRAQILSLLGIEGALLTSLAIGAGSLLGWCISLILVFIVNPQSFHWTM